MNGKIWVLGDAVVDLLPDGEGRLLQCPGGAPANVAVGVARLGGDSGFIGRVGDDPFGRFMLHTLGAGASGCELYAPRCGAAHLHGGGRSR